LIDFTAAATALIPISRFSLIEGMTLIKLADLYDNVSSVAHTLPLLDKKWTTSFFLPIVVPMKK
jgi:hypothetical protein